MFRTGEIEEIKTNRKDENQEKQKSDHCNLVYPSAQFSLYVLFVHHEVILDMQVRSALNLEKSIHIISDHKHFLKTFVMQ